MPVKKKFWGRLMQGRQTEVMSADYVGLDTWPDERALSAMLDAQSRGVAAVRTAFDDDATGAHNAHDANYLTFHRWNNFRSLK